MPQAWSKEFGGNGACHCVHLVELTAVVDSLKDQGEEMSEIKHGEFDPWGDPTIGGPVRSRRWTSS